MAPKPIYHRPPRTIPNWNMAKPWTSPLTRPEADALAQTAVIGGGPDTDRYVTTLLQSFAGQYVESLANAGQT